MSADNYDLKVVVEGDTNQDIFNFVARKLATLQGVRATRTHFLMQIYKENDIVYVDSDKDNREAFSS